MKKGLETGHAIGTEPMTIDLDGDSMPVMPCSSGGFSTEAAPSFRKSRRQFSLSGRSRMGRTMGVEIASVGSYVPETIVRNEDLSELGFDSQWITRRTGILERRRASPDQASSDLAVNAAKQCLDRAGVCSRDVDLIIVATLTPDQMMPSTACHVQRELNCIAPAMDVSAACAGFMYGLVTAAQFVGSGAAANALVIGTEVMSRVINPEDAKTYPLFGDGAGAVLLRPTKDGCKGLESYTLGSEGACWQMLNIPSGGSRQMLTPERLLAGEHYLQMEGQGVFKWAVRAVSDSIRDCLAHAKLTIDDLDLMVLHQANIRIIDSAISDFHIERSKVVVNLERYGNTSAASIPLVLDEAIRTGRLPPKGRVLMCGFGAGLTWGTSIVRF